MKPILDRIDYRSDQRLDRCDLTQSSRRTRDLLDLHIARGHGVWGVASGLQCSVAKTGVVITAGIAIDMHGRQLVNIADRPVPAPSVSGAQAFDLVVRAGDAQQDPCDPCGMPIEGVDVRWVAAGPVQDDLDEPPLSNSIVLGLDVPLARLRTDENGKMQIDYWSRRVAHPIARPKIASGVVPQATAMITGSYANWTLPVPTASAGFPDASSPVYFVSLGAHPFGDTALLRATGPQPPGLATRLTWGGPIVSIEFKSNTSFLIRVVTVTDDKWALDTSDGTTMRLNPVDVSWIGIETPDPAPYPIWYFPFVFLEMEI
jgi:hypothetical protein